MLLMISADIVLTLWHRTFHICNVQCDAQSTLTLYNHIFYRSLWVSSSSVGGLKQGYSLLYHHKETHFYVHVHRKPLLRSMFLN